MNICVKQGSIYLLFRHLHFYQLSMEVTLELRLSGFHRFYETLFILERTFCVYQPKYMEEHWLKVNSRIHYYLRRRLFLPAEDSMISHICLKWPKIINKLI